MDMVQLASGHVNFDISGSGKSCAREIVAMILERRLYADTSGEYKVPKWVEPLVGAALVMAHVPDRTFPAPPKDEDLPDNLFFN